jgi:hypothetical protein
MEATARAAGPHAYASYELIRAQKRKREEDTRMRERVASELDPDSYFGLNREGNARAEHLQQRIFDGTAAVASLTPGVAVQSPSAAATAQTSSAAAAAAQTSSAAAAAQTSSAAAAAQTSSAAAAEKLTPNRPPGWLCACKSVTTRGRPRHVAACVVVAMEKQLVHVGAEVCMLASALPTWGKWRAVVVQPSKVVWQPVNGEGGDPQKSEVVVERRSTK